MREIKAFLHDYLTQSSFLLTHEINEIANHILFARSHCQKISNSVKKFSISKSQKTTTIQVRDFVSLHNQQ